DLSAYAGEQVYIGFYVYSDGSITRPGWYIDDVALSDTMKGDAPTNMAPRLMQENAPTQSKEEMAKENAEKLGFGSQHMLMPVNESAYDSVEASDDGNESLEAELNALPLYAQVSVLETGRSAKT